VLTEEVEQEENAEVDDDAASRAALRQQLEECGLQPASSAASAHISASTSSRDVEREERLWAVLARLRRERAERLAAPTPPPRASTPPPAPPSALSTVEGVVQQQPAAAATTTTTTTRRPGLLDDEHSKCTPFSPTTSPPTSLAPQLPSSPPTTLAARIHESRAFLSGVLGGEAEVRRAYELVARGRANTEEEAGAKAQLAAEVFAGPKAKYLSIFLHLLEMEKGAEER
jgi:hypothetical protein